MANSQNINEPTPEIAKWHQRWRKNRDFVEGEDAVKARGETYLRRIRPDDTDAQYARSLENTNFYPAAVKITQGVNGLIFRKKAQLATSSARVELLSRLITPDLRSLDDLAEWAVLETQITNFCGLLVDHPDASDFTGLSAANALQRGFRPRVAGYAAECILELAEGFIGQDVKLVHVRLLEDHGDTVRQLLINDDGLYEVRVHRNVGGGFVLASTTVPRIDGQPLTQIPFVLVSTQDKLCPTPSLIQHCVDLNLAHYRASGTRANMEWWTSGPQLIITGYQADDNGDNPELDFSPNSFIGVKNPDAKVYYNIYDPKGFQANKETLDGLKQDLSTLGHSILAPEKAAPEAPETQILRRAAENAALAGFTRRVSRKLEEALQLFARWADPTNADLTYSLNLDFTPSAMSPQEMTALMAAWQAGAITHETFLYALRDGELVSPALDVELEVERARQEAADRPPVL